MEYIQDAGFIFIMVSTIALLTYLDKKFNLGLSEASGYSGTSQKDKLNDKDKTIIELQKRVQILEKIVTDPAEQLKREIDKL